MKKIFIIIIAFLSIPLLYSQEKKDTLSGSELIAVGVCEPIGIDNSNAATILTNNILQAITLNGLSATDSRFIVIPKVALVEKSVTPTAPPKYVAQLEISLFLADLYTGTILSQSSFEVKGIGRNDAQAYISAVRNVTSRHSKLKTMIVVGKDKIIAYFNGEAANILSRIQGHINRKDFSSAMIEALSIPSACSELYQKASDLIAQIPYEKKKEVKLSPTIINNYYYTQPKEERASIIINNR
jgi:hypothetical protein